MRWLALLLLTLPCLAQNTVPMAKANGRMIVVVPCIVGGQHMRCLLDSGAEYTTINKHHKISSYDTGQKFNSLGFNGNAVELALIRTEVQIGTTKIDSLALRGDVHEFPECDVVIGESTLRQFGRIAFDFQARMVELGK